MEARPCGCTCARCEIGAHCFNQRKGCCAHPDATLPSQTVSKPTRKPRPKKKTRWQEGLPHIERIQKTLEDSDEAERKNRKFTKPPPKQS